MGRKRTLKEDMLKRFSSKFLKLSSTLTNNCDDLALYRGEIFDAGDGEIGLTLIGSDVDGNIKFMYITIDQRTGEFVYKNIIGKGRVTDSFRLPQYKFTNTMGILKAILDVIEVAESCNLQLSNIYFEIANDGYKCAKAEKDPKEEGSYILYMFSNEELVEKFDLEEFSVINRRSISTMLRSLCENWG